MNLLSLPPELLSQIVQHVFEPWEFRIIKSLSAGGFDVICNGYPNEGVASTCRFLHDEAKIAIERSFSNRLVAEGHDGNHLGILCDAFVQNAQDHNTHRLLYLLKRVHTIRYINVDKNPSLWRLYTSLDLYPRLRRIELDCRYRFHFAVHTVPNMVDFLNGSDGELAKLMDFRKTYFLSCERFINYVVERGITVAVLRDMGVREGKGKCDAVLVTADYVHDVTIGTKLDMNTVRTKSKPIVGWPQGIRAALATLQM